MTAGKFARRALWVAFLVWSTAGVASATNLDVALRSGGQTSISVAPGATVSWAAVGVLTDGLNNGLALFSFDVTWSAGPLAPAAAPTVNPMLNFARPAGLNNPAGFGGTVVAGRLVQVGGAQNTIKNSFAPYPTGTVITGVGMPGQPVTLASGQLTAPVQPGTYTLTPSAVVANVIRQGETGTPFWHVDRSGPGTLTPLTVTVTSLKRR